MSDLELAAKPVLTPILLGKRTVLVEQDQTILAQWIAKTAMTFQCTTPRKPIPRRHYRYLYDHRRPPPSSQAWVGIRTAEDGVVVSGLQSARIGAPTNAEEVDFHYAYLVTIGIGFFFGQMSGNDLPRLDFGWGHEGTFAEAVAPIWPFVEIVEWPPKQAVRSINDLGEDPAFGEHLTRSLRAVGVDLRRIEPE